MVTFQISRTETERTFSSFQHIPWSSGSSQPLPSYEARCQLPYFLKDPSGNFLPQLNPGSVADSFLGSSLALTLLLQTHLLAQALESGPLRAELQNSRSAWCPVTGHVSHAYLRS